MRIGVSISLSLLTVLVVAASSIARAQEAPEQARPREVPPVPSAGPRVEVALPWPPEPGAYRWIIAALPSERHGAPEVAAGIAAVETAMREFHERRIAPLLGLSEECAAGLGPHGSAAAAARFRHLVTERNRAVASMETRERELLAQLCDELEVDEAGRAAIERGRLGRRREDLLMLRCDLAPARISLEQVLGSVDAARASEEERACLSKVFDAYAEEIHGLHAQRVRMRLREMVDDAVAFTSSPEDVTTIVESRRRRSAPRVRVERLLVEANREWALRVADCMAPASGRRFLAEYRARSFPLVHPNRFSLTAVMDELSELKSAGSREPVLEVLVALERRMEEDSQRMEAMCLDVQGDWARSHAGRTPAQREEDLAAQIEPLKRRQREAAAQAVALLQAEGLAPLLPSLPRLAESIAEP